MQFKETVTFSSYGEIELKSILEARVGHSVVASDVLTYVSKKVAETKGDARQAFDMLKNAVVFCRQQLTSGQISSGPLVTMKHVVVANKDSADLKRRLDGLSSFGKTMFCILVSLARGGRLQTTVGVLRDLVSECLSCTGSLDEQVTWDDYLVMLETLNDMGLLRLSMGNADDSRLINLAGIELAVAAKMPLCLGIQLEEVERAMINELKEPFYQKLRDNAKEILHGG
jgi:Cdc6-like AAA superfamily ATPase